MSNQVVDTGYDETQMLVFLGALNGVEQSPPESAIAASKVIRKTVYHLGDGIFFIHEGTMKDLEDLRGTGFNNAKLAGVMPS